MKAAKIITTIIIILSLVVGLGIYAFIQYFVKVPKLEITETLSRNQQVEQIDKWLISLNSKQKFNGVVLMIVNGETILEKGYGYTDHTLQNTLTPQSSLRLASVSKQFTAAGILALHDQGGLNIDDNVELHVQAFPYEGVTIRHLLNQTSGVPDNYMSLGEANVKRGSFLSLEQAVKFIVDKDAPAASEPNSRYSYSNTNYILLARIVEIVSGESFEDFMQNTIFTPMGMKNTRVWNALSSDKTYPNKTEGFDFITIDDVKPIELTVLDGVAGDGGIFSSIEDFKIWNSFWTKNPIIKPETLAQAFIAPELNDGTKSDYGFGWVLTPNAHWHNGQWLAAQSFIARNENQNNCLVIIDNSYRLSFDNITSELAKAMRTLNKQP